MANNIKTSATTGVGDGKLNTLIREKSKYIKGVIIDEGVTTLKENAFRDCDNLNKISIPSTLTNIEDSAFNGLSETLIIVSKTNKDYKVENDTLYNFGKTKIIQYFGQSTDLEIPNSVTEISPNAFKNNKTIEKLGVHETTTLIGNDAFLNMKALKKIEVYGKTITQDTWNGIVANAGIKDTVATDILESRPIYKNLAYSELDQEIPKLQDNNIYDLTIDTTGVDANEFKGIFNMETREIANSPLMLKLCLAPACVKFRLTLSIPDTVIDATMCFAPKLTPEGVPGTSNLISINITNKTTNIQNATGMFGKCSSLTSIDTSVFTKVTNATNMFNNCNSLTSIDTSAFTNVTDANGMFAGCSNLTSIDTKAFTKVTNAIQMFAGCSNLTNITWGDEFRPTTINGMFSNATAAKTIKASADSMTWINTNAAAMDLTNYTFSRKELALTYSQLDTDLPNLEPYNIYDLTLDCSGIDNTTLKSLGSKLQIAPSSASINLIPTNIGSDFVDASSMFNNCISLVGINTDTFTALTNTSNMFANCRNLVDIVWGKSFKPTENVTDMFTGANAAKTITAYSDVITWIDNNATAMGLTNYNCVKDPREEEEIVNTIYTGLSEMYNPVISVPSFTFNGVTCNNVDFVFMGIAESEGNLGKAIYMSTDCLPEVQVSMDSLLAGSTNGDVGTGTIGAAAATSLDAEIFKITNKHLQEYTRTYDDKTHTEKVFFPLECEVFGKIEWSADTSTLEKYPQWEGFKKNPDSRIKYIDYQQKKYETWYWWEANKSWDSGYFCGVRSYGSHGSYASNHSNTGCGVAFCL